MIVQHPLQRFGIAARISLVCASHQQGEVHLLCIVPGEVGMDAFGDLPKNRLQTWRRVKFLGLLIRGKRGIVGLLRSATTILCSATR